jgi:exosome complex component RRP46
VLSLSLSLSLSVAYQSRSSCLNNADGSAKFSFGSSACVLVGCYGPVAANARDEQTDQAVLEVSTASSAQQSGIYDTELELFVKGCAEHVVLRAAHPRTAVVLSSQVFGGDGSTLAAAVNAACLALLDASVPMRSLVVAVCCAVLDDGSVLLDPTAAEESAARGLLTVAFDSTLSGIVLTHAAGVIETEQFFECCELARKACSRLLAFVRATQQKHFEPARE